MDRTRHAAERATRAVSNVGRDAGASRPISPRARWLTVASWFLFGLVSGLQIQISMLDHGHSWALLLGHQVLVWSAWIPYSLAIVALVRWMPLVPPRLPAVATHLAIAVAFGVAHVALWVAVELWLRPYDFMNATTFGPRFEAMTLVQVPLEVVLYALVVLVNHALELAAREREREQRAARLEQSLAEARLHALELQIQPHFLFNTLNAIGSLVRAGQGAEALAMLGGLSDLLRYSLDHAGGARVPLAAELAMVERYLDIQRVRFPDRLAVELDVPAELRRAELPVLLLQPLAENAIQHGIATNSAAGRVTLRVRRAGDELQLELWNTGRLAAARRDGIGLSATRSRLAQLYGHQGRLELAEQDGGVVARVSIPWSTGA